MKAKDLRVLSKAELSEKLEGLKKQLMDLQFKRQTGAEKPHMFRQARRTMARILTVLKEKESA
ncbi:MAG: 50S ribosomal protein L29 [Candidatus Omnitrophica bacterium]|nr:50S ribosomal protein L29 [Candidatus Omnitrophota bacterium]